MERSPKSAVFSVSSLIWDLTALAIPLVACLPFLIGLATELWQDHRTMIGPFVWLIIIGIVAVRGRGTITNHLARTLASIAFCLIGLGLLITGLVYWSFSLVALSFCFSLAGWGVERFSNVRWHEPVSWAVLLAITIPIGLIHFDLDRWITIDAATAVSTVIDAHGTPHFLENSRFNLGTGSFDVLSATSAKLGLYSLMCFSAILTWFRSRSLSHSIVLTLVGAAFCLWVTRFFAILTVVLGSLALNEDWTSSNWQHYLISGSAFVVAIGLILVLDRAFACLYAPVPSLNPENYTLFATVNTILVWPRESLAEDDTAPEFLEFKEEINAWERSWYTLKYNDSRILVAVAVSCAVLSLITLIPTSTAISASGLTSALDSPPILELVAIDEKLKESILPTQYEQFQLKSYSMLPIDTEESPRPKQSVLELRWNYLWDGNVVTVDCKAPIGKLEDPTIALQSDEVETTAKLMKGLWPWYDCRVTNTFGGDIYIFQCCLPDDLSEDVKVTQNSPTRLPLFRRMDNVDQRKDWLYEIRVSTEPGLPLTPDKKEELLQFFEFVRKQLREKMPVDMIKSNAIYDSGRSQ